MKSAGDVYDLSAGLYWPAKKYSHATQSRGLGSIMMLLLFPNPGYASPPHPSSPQCYYSPISKGKHGPCYQILRKEIHSTKGLIESLPLKRREAGTSLFPQAGPCPYLQVLWHNLRHYPPCSRLCLLAWH